MAKRVSVDGWLFTVTLILVFLGLVMVFSASAVMAKERYGSGYYFLLRQVGWAAGGIAAMLVAMIVGAIRTLAEQSHDPLAMLEGLNRRLCGRLTHQFATCLAIYLRANGEATAANAGQLP